jgi:acetyl-CoA C-acetyltransferase
MDPRTPVIVGAGQVTHRPGDAGDPSSLELMVEASRAAAADAGAGGDALLARAGAVGVVDLFYWVTGDPAALLSDELGIAPRETLTTARGGTSPVLLLGAVAGDIAAGRLDCALLAGGEAATPFMRAMRAGEPTGWPVQPEGTEPSRKIGTDRDPHHPAELAAGLIVPAAWYPMFEQSLRASDGLSQSEHIERTARIWARFAAVAADNAHAWTRDAPDAAAIGTPSPANRLVSAPYTKLMNANMNVDQGAALLVCSVEAAQAAGIAPERWIFVDSTAVAHDRWFAGEREVLHRSPAIAASGRTVLAHAEASIDDVTLLDLYSCFPIAVQIAARELGIDLEDPSRAPTVTGGLTFAGGPANNYVMHSLATLTEKLRGEPGRLGLATAVGWYMTKHGAALLSSSPPERPFESFDVQDDVEGLPHREIASETAAEAPIESYTAIYGKDGAPTIGIVSALLEDGRRAVARSHDAATLAELTGSDPLGSTAVLDGAAGFTLA